ncbi:MAG: glycoside hydrolase family 9 protein [Prevotellaceae bacterium]|jgi:endoglucanase|nr:glycoside hydrolase family 9 protein [Prevotellaceae bacterium]
MKTNRMKNLLCLGGMGVAIVMLSLEFVGCGTKEMPTTDVIRFNQVGFYPMEAKTAVIYGDSVGNRPFLVRNTDNGEVVYKGISSAPRGSDFSPVKTSVLSFDVLNRAGTYRIEVTDVGQSHPFVVGENILQDLSKSTLKAFYLQRASMPIEEQYAGEYARPLGHPDDHVLIHPSAVSPGRPVNAVISSPKGWYDAGDYNKYIVNSGFTVGMLLALYEDYPEAVRNLKVNIPESSNQTPDLLDEAFWNIDWMLTMQDPADGGVYHKLTTPNFEGFVKPTDCKQPRYVVEKSVTAALDFAASLAQAARIYDDYAADYPGLSEKLLSAAKRAYQWAQKHPEAYYMQNQMNEKYDPDVATGTYGDRRASDEFFWAAVELYITTHDETYLKAIEQYFPAAYTLPTWGGIGGLGYLTLIRYQDSEDAKIKPWAERAAQHLQAYAEKTIDGADATAYAASYGRSARDFFWGCNSERAAGQGITFLYAWRQSTDKKYLTAALNNMDYLLGRNATGYCYITGAGFKSPMYPHHRLAGSDDIVNPLPGFLVGGPNPGRQDGAEYPSDIPDEAYADVEGSYASNEIAINWQGSFVCFVTALAAALS